MNVYPFKGITVKLRPNLNCKSFGINAAVCTNFESNFVGQTKNRWTDHRANWNKSKFSPENISDEWALHFVQTQTLLF